MSQTSSNPCREIITVNIGGFGVNIGQYTLEQYCVEQGISKSGDKEYKTNYDTSLRTTFKETAKGKHIARSMFCDLDPLSINMMQCCYPYMPVLNDDFIIHGTDGSHGNFAKGHYTTGKEIIDRHNQALRLLVEDCDNIQGFIIQHSISGGTGGGFGSLVLERIAVDYRKKCKVGFHSLYDKNRSFATFEVYNALATIHWLLDHTEISIFLDNQKLYNICKNVLNIKTPRYKNYNGLSTKLLSTITAPFRFGLNGGNMLSLVQDMVPYPRLHFLVSGLSPIAPKLNDKKVQKESSSIIKDDISTLTRHCVMEQNWLQEIEDYDWNEDKYMAMQFMYRGNGIGQYMKEANDRIRYLSNNGYKYIQWSNIEPSVRFIDAAIVSLPSDDVYVGDKQVVMLGNNTSIIRPMDARTGKLYDTLYSQRSWVHWWVGEVMVILFIPFASVLFAFVIVLMIIHRGWRKVNRLKLEKTLDFFRWIIWTF